MNRTIFAPIRARAILRGSLRNPGLRGEVRFVEKRNGVLVTVRISGLPASGFFALHLHEGSGCGGPDFADSGGHYNPGARPHPEHAGDLPPLLSCGGEAYLSVLTDRFRVRDVVGRTMVVHSDPDDFHTQPAGNAGTKIACGEITAG